MEDYDAKSPFSSFLPAVAGYFGKPVWAFYVNRGQVRRFLIDIDQVLGFEYEIDCC